MNEPGRGRFAAWMGRMQRRPRILVAVAGLLSCLSLGGISTIDLETDLFALLPPGLPGLEAFLDATRHFGTLDAVYGVFEGPTAEATQAYVDAFAAEAGRSPRVRLVVAKASSEWSAAGGVPPAALFRLEPASLDALVRRLDPGGFDAAMERVRRYLHSPVGSRAPSWIQRDPLGLQRSLLGGLASLPRPAAVDAAGYLGKAGPRGYQILVPIEPAEPMGDLAGSRALMGDLRRAEAGARQALLATGMDGLRAGFTGGHAVSVEESRSLRSDIAGTLAVSLALVLLVFWSFFRNVRVMLTLGASLVVSVVLGLGLLSLYPGRLNPATAGFAAVLCGLAVDYGIHLYNGLRLTGHAALGEMYRVVGRSVTLGALTTAGAFLSLCASGFPGLREFGLVMVAGILASLAVMTTLFVALNREVAAVGPGRVAVICGRWEAGLWRRRRWVVSGSLAAVVLLCPLGWSGIRYEPNVRKLASRGETWRVQEAILAGFGNRLEPVILVWEGADLAAGLTAMAALDDAAGEHQAVDHAETPLLFYPRPERVEAVRMRLAGYDAEASCGQLRRAAADAGLVPAAFDPACASLRELAATASLAPGVALSTPLFGGAWEEGLRRRFVSREGARVRLAAYVYPTERLTEPAAAKALAQALGAEGPEWRVAGFGLLAGPLQEALFRDLGRTLSLAGVLVLAAVFLGLPSPAHAALALLPVGLASALTLAAMGLLGLSLNPVNFAAIPLVLGIGIDDGLHLCTQAWAQPERPVAGVLAESGWAISCTTATTLAGFGSLLFARHGGLFSLGVLACLGVGLSYLTTVILLPPLLRGTRGGAR